MDVDEKSRNGPGINFQQRIAYESSSIFECFPVLTIRRIITRENSVSPTHRGNVIIVSCLMKSSNIRMTDYQTHFLNCDESSEGTLTYHLPLKEVSLSTCYFFHLYEYQGDEIENQEHYADPCYSPDHIGSVAVSFFTKEGVLRQGRRIVPLFKPFISHKGIPEEYRSDENTSNIFQLCLLGISQNPWPEVVMNNNLRTLLRKCFEESVIKLWGPKNNSNNISPQIEFTGDSANTSLIGYLNKELPDDPFSTPILGNIVSRDPNAGMTHDTFFYLAGVFLDIELRPVLLSDQHMEDLRPIMHHKVFRTMVDELPKQNSETSTLVSTCHKNRISKELTMLHMNAPTDSFDSKRSKKLESDLMDIMSLPLCDSLTQSQRSIIIENWDNPIVLRTLSRLLQALEMDSVHVSHRTNGLRAIPRENGFHGFASGAPKILKGIIGMGIKSPPCEIIASLSPFSPSIDFNDIGGLSIHGGEVRKMLVKEISSWGDETLLKYLLQLVVCIRFDEMTSKLKQGGKGRKVFAKNTIGDLLTSRACGNVILATKLYWLAHVEYGCDTKEASRVIFTEIVRIISSKCKSLSRSMDNGYSLTGNEIYINDKMDSLINGIEVEQPIKERLAPHLGKCRRTTAGDIIPQLNAQRAFRNRLHLISQNITENGNTVESRNEILRNDLRYPELFKALNSSSETDEQVHSIITMDLTKEMNKNSLETFLLIPVDPSLRLIRIDPEKSYVMKSASKPIVICCIVEPVFDQINDSPRSPYHKYYMYKVGGDLRQDQLVIQLISLMEEMHFSHSGYKLPITCYKTLAMSPTDGLVEFVDRCSPLSKIIEETPYGIRGYLAKCGMHVMQLEVIGDVISTSSDVSNETNNDISTRFIDSCAAYCVITYVLGVGDRHLDNLMIDETGRFFHVDFGYLFGSDPKPFSPPVKLRIEMINGMGGVDSHGYVRFEEMCRKVFSSLKSNARILMGILFICYFSNLSESLQNMADTSGKVDYRVTGTRKNYSFAVIDIIAERLCPGDHYDDGEKRFIALLRESSEALFPRVLDKLHDWAQYLTP